MDLYLDTEFNDTGTSVQLISIGVIGPGYSCYYAVLNDFNYEAAQANLFLAEHVLPKLEPRDQWKSREEVVSGLQTFLEDLRRPAPYFGKDLHFWAWKGAYDWLCLVQLFGRVVDLPEGWPYAFNDLYTLHRALGEPVLLPKSEKLRHHALYDADWLRRAHILLKPLMQQKGLTCL